MHRSLGVHRLLRNITSTFARHSFVSLIQVAIVIAIARFYGPEGSGSYAVALLLPTLLASFLNLGISSANVYYLGSRQVPPRVAFRSTMCIFLYISPLGLILGGAILYFHADRLFPGIGMQMLWVSLLVFPLVLLLQFVSGFFQGVQNFLHFNFILLLQPFATLLSILVLKFFDIHGLHWLLFAYLFGTVIALLFSIHPLISILKKDVSSTIENYTNKALNYGSKSHLSNILTFINYKVDIYLVNFFLSPVSAGIYIIAVQLSEKLWILSYSAATVLLPRLSELSNDEEKRKVITPFICRWVVLMTLAGAIILFTIAHPLIQLLFGELFTDAVKPLVLLLPGIVAFSGLRIIASAIAARGRPEINLYISLVVVALNVTMNLLLIPIYGLSGAALSTSVSYIICFILGLIIHQYLTGVHFLRCLLPHRREYSEIKNFLLNS
jgi:O-antigen/teichoic acid export membrane protein